ncbi:S-layer homology domain-containing protein [Paenibacillus marinisediminis]
MKKRLLWLSLMFALLIGGISVHAAEGGSIIYVKADAAGNNDGSSWTHAYTDLHQALTEAGKEGKTEVWIAKGTYMPSGNMSADDVRRMHFEMMNGVAIRGGFEGSEDVQSSSASDILANRQFKKNETILSGDIDKDGKLDNNVYNVFVNNGLNNTAVLDGVTITGGNADGWLQAGGGMLNSESSPTLTNVTFDRNKAVNGGAMSNDGSPVLTNVTISNNSAESGGGIHNSSQSRTTMTNVLIINNKAQRGGGVFNAADSDAVMTNVTISGNEAQKSGGGIYNAKAAVLKLRNSIVWGNQDPAEGSIYNDKGKSLISHSLVQDSKADGKLAAALGKNEGGNLDSDPLFQGAGSYQLKAASPAIDKGSNIVYESGQIPNLSKIVTDLNGSPRIVNGVVDMGAYEYGLNAAPKITLSVTPDTPTIGPVQVNVKASSQGKDNTIVLLKWAADKRDAAYFADEGTEITSAMKFTVSKNGTYTVYAKDKAGNEAVSQVEVSNILTSKPTITATLTPSESTNQPVQVSVTANAQGEGNTITLIKWAADKRDTAYFADGGTEITSTKKFTVSKNGIYTVYAKDKAGNEVVSQVEVSNILASKPTITAKLTPSESTSQPVQVSVTANAQGEGNTITLIKWAADKRDTAYFADGGTEITSTKKFTVSKNGTYTVYAKDKAGNEAVSQVEVSNILTSKPTVTTTLLPSTLTNKPVEVIVTANAQGADDTIASLKWAVGKRDEAYFAGKGTDITAAKKFTVSESDTYTIYAKDSASNVTIKTIEIINILLTKPTIATSSYPQTSNAGSVDVTVSATVHGTGNAISKIKWAAGDRNVAYFAADGNDITSTAKFRVTSNGTCTVYVKDAAGNESVKQVDIRNISEPMTPPWCDLKSYTLRLSAWKAGEMSIADLITVKVPADATDMPLCMYLEQVSGQDKPLDSGYVLLSPVYQLEKNHSNKFLKPITISMSYDRTKLSRNSDPGVYFYDKANKRWVEKNSTVDGSRITIDVDNIGSSAIFAVIGRGSGNGNGGDNGNKPISFTDIARHWAKDAIIRAAEMGIVKGDPDGRFRPNASVSRAEFVVMVMNALDLNTSESRITFTDQAKIPSWAEKAVSQAVRLGIVTGYEDGSFRPNASISRAEMTAIIGRTMGIEPLNVKKTGFDDDASIPAWVKAMAETLRREGIVEGSNGRLEAHNNATRAEAVVMILRMLDHR